jgi:AcrR family transcriptional regulator
MAVRRRTPSRLLEGKILQAALQLLDEQGFRALTVRGIANRAGVAPMGIYNRFESKSGIYDALWIEGFGRLTATLKEAPASDEPMADLIEAGRRYQRFAIENPSYYRLMFMGSASGYEPSAEALGVGVECFDVILDVVRRLQRAGHGTQFDDRALAQVIWASIHGHASLRMLNLCFAGSPDDVYDFWLTNLSTFLTRT